MCDTRCMAMKIIRGFGVSLLSLCLGFAFLSNENLIVRLKSAPSQRVGGKFTQISEVAFTTFGSFDQDESKEKDLTDEIAVRASAFFSFILIDSAQLTNIEPKTRTFILQDLYLGLPPPV